MNPNWSTVTSMIDLKYILILLQYGSLSISGILALLGLLYNFKDKETGRLTRWGRIAVIGLALSVIAGVGSKTIELSLQRKAQESDAEKTRSAAEQTLVIVTNVQRMTSAVNQVYVTLSLGLPIESEALRPFQEQIHQRLGETQWEPDLSGSEFRNLLKDERWRRNADALLRPDNLAILIYPKGTKLPTCVLDLDNQPVIGFYVPVHIKSLKYVQFGTGFTVLIETEITQFAKQRPQVMSLMDFNGGTAIVYCRIPQPVIKEVAPAIESTDGPAPNPEFDEAFPRTPWQISDLMFSFDGHRNVYVDSLVTKQDCTGLVYYESIIAIQPKTKK